MKFSLLAAFLICLNTYAFAEDFNLREELNPEINNEQVEVRTYTHDNDGASITEYRSGGKVWMIKVQPAGDFPPYYLYDDKGTGTFQRRIAGNEQPTPTPPMWILKRF